MTPAEVCLWPQPGAWSPQGRTPARPETPGEDIALGEGWWLLWDPNPCLNTLGPDWEEKSQSRRRESLLTLPWLPGSLAQTSGHQPLTSSPWAWLLPHSYFSYLIFSYLPKRNVISDILFTLTSLLRLRTCLEGGQSLVGRSVTSFLASSGSWTWGSVNFSYHSLRQYDSHCISIVVWE